MFLLRKSTGFFFNNFSTQTTTSFSSSMKWRNKIKQTQLISQISSLLLQRQNYVPLLDKLNLSSCKLAPNIFFQILHKTQKNPQICLNFFNWTKTHLGFCPDFKSHCKLIQILVCNGLIKPAKPLTDSLIGVQSASIVIDSMIETCKDSIESQGLVCSVVLECYSKHGLVFDGLEIFRRIVNFKIYPISIHSCNALLDSLQRKNEVKLAWCFCGSIVRCGVSVDMFTWSLIARLLCKEGKIANAVKMLNSGFTSAVIYDLVIQFYCQMGNYVNAMDYLNEMYCKNFTPGFRIYSLVLDVACKDDNVGVVAMIISDMVAKELLPAKPFSDFNPIIQKFCEFGRSYAAEMLFENALKEKSGVHKDSYGCMLRVLCKEGRVKEARRVYGMIKVKGISLSRSSYCAFADAICKEEPSEEVDKLLKDIIARGFVPHGPELSKLIADHCKQGRWKEAENLLNLIFEKRMLPDSFSCSSLVEYYCANGHINLAVALNDRIRKLGGTLDVTTYNLLLIGLFKERKTGEAIQVFDYMRSLNLGSSTSFSIMIIGLCHEREMRKAMKIHDEMLNVRLKPDKATYKRLISKFS